MMFIRKTVLKTSQATVKSIVKTLKPLINNVNNVTYDNGGEFSKHEKLTKHLILSRIFVSHITVERKER